MDERRKSRKGDKVAALIVGIFVIAVWACLKAGSDEDDRMGLD